MTQQLRRNGCFQVFKVFWTIIFFVIALSMTGVNLFFSNMFGETCGYIHPYIFDIEVSVIDEDGLMIATKDSIPTANDEDVLLYQDAGWMSTATGATLDTYLRIYDASGETLLEYNDDTGSGYNSEVSSFSVADNQQIIIEVGTYADSYSGVFELTVRDNGATSDITAGDYFDEEFFDTPVDGGALGSSMLADGVTVEGEIYEFERVRYTVDIQAGREYVISVDGTEGFIDDSLAAHNWAGCLQYYGFVNNDGFTINSNGYFWFVPFGIASKAEENCQVGDDALFREFLEQCVNASVSVSPTGRLIFFVLLSILVVGLPILIVDALEGQRETIWYLFLLLVAVQATTTAMLFLHLGSVSGIEALAEFGYGIFGGITTGSALAFIDKLVNRAEDGTSMMFPPDNERQ